ncbi:MAG: glutamate-cysteine ligase family protein [Cyclobacteriaceae bacterium]
MEKNTPLHLFQAFGVELEYMIVDKNTLNVKPIADQLLKSVLGDYGDEYENGSVTWSNELVSHVIEIKCTRPTANLVQLAKDFAANVRRINELLAPLEARLMPTAAHPWMNPEKETQLWPYGNKEIYSTYDRIFNCKGHGWSNLQSTHLNLPFASNEEFGRLHAAIRMLLPVLPALTASSPILDGQFSGMMDKRLDYYRNNQKKIPQICGSVIPEQAFSKVSYDQMIYSPIEEAITAYDPDQILEAVWLNSRGAIARFDRGAIEIRILDIQESPASDLALLSLIIAALRWMTDEKSISLQKQMDWPTELLYSIFDQVIQKADQATIKDAAYLSAMGVDQNEASLQQFWQQMHQQLKQAYPEWLAPWNERIGKIISQGSLAGRIVKAAEGHFNQPNLKLIYQELSDCLQEDEFFETWQKQAY